MTPLKIQIFSLFLFLSGLETLFSQDSLYIYDDLAVHYRDINSDSSEYFLRKFIQSVDQKDKENLAYAFTFYGVLKKQKGQLDSALFYYNKAIKFQKAIDHREGIAGNYNNIGNVYKQKGDYVQAISFYQMSKDIFLETGMEEQLFLVIENLSELYLAVGKIDDAVKELEISNNYFIQHNKLSGIGLVQSCLSDVSLAQGDTLEAILHIDSAQNTFKQINQSTKFVTHGIKQCELLFLLDSLDKNTLLLDSYLEMAKKLDLTIEQGQLLTLYAKIDIKHQKYQTSIPLLLEAIEMIHSSGSQRYLIDGYLLLSVCYENIQDYQNALKYYQLYTETYTKIQGIEIQKDFQSLQVQYDVLEKEKALDESKLNLLEKENKLQQANLNIQREEQQVRIILIVVIFISILSVFLFLRFREKHKLSRKLSQTLEERNLLLKEIHHRVKNNLQIINSLLNLQKNRGSHSTPDEIITQTQDRIYSMAIIHEKLYQSENFSNISIKDYVETLIEHFIASQNLKEKNVNVHYIIDEFSLPLDSLIPIGLILNETFTNSAKYAFDERGGIIQVVIHTTFTTFTILYEDNGKGLPDEFSIEKSNSLGMKLIKGFTKQLNGKLEVDASKGLKLFFTFIKK